MNKSKLLFMIPMVLGVFLASCGGGGETSNPSSNTPGSSASVVIKYTVKFANTSMPDVEIEEGKTLAKPTDPKKDNHVFMGWYNEATFETEVVFPLTITKDTTIYANFYSHQEAFQKARNNTIGEGVPGYEYDYSLNISATYMNVGLTGATTGNSKYNAAASDVSFYDAHTNSGALMYDGSKYTIKKGNKLHVVTLNEDGEINRYNIKDVDASYTYDSSSFAKAVFEYSEDQLKTIKTTSVANEYELVTSFNFSKAVALVGNYLNHPVVEALLCSLPETSVETGMFVKFASDKLSSYRYVMEVNVTGLIFNLTYELQFKNIGVAPTISPKTFGDTAISEEAITPIKNEINTMLNTYKAQVNSSYDFKAKTKVDFPHKNAINATIDGFTKRKMINNVSYYLNDYEVDSDLKNADLYKEAGLGDAHGGRAKLADGTVHDLKKKVLGGYDDLGTVTATSVDDFYLLDLFAIVDNPTFIKKEVGASETHYVIGSSDEHAVELLKYFNNNLRINPLGECSVDVKAFGSFTDNSVVVKEIEFEIVAINGVLSEIELDINGQLATSYPSSRDFTTTQTGGFELEYSLTVTDDGKGFEPAESVKKI